MGASNGQGIGAPLRFGLTPVFVDDQISFLHDWQDYLGRRLNRPVTFVQRSTYQEITDMLLRGQLDAAWVCGYPYVRHRDRLQLVAVPLYHNRPLYRSYLIAHADDGSIQGWSDLEGKVFAYSDPDSNSGYLYPQYAMQQGGIDPQRIFRKVFFTFAHRNVVRAVAEGLADAGAVDGYVWDTLSQTHPALTARTRVVARSPRFGFPPIVARPRLSPLETTQLRSALLGMASDPEGQGLLRRLNLDGFEGGEPGLFDSIHAMMAAVAPRSP